MEEGPGNLQCGHRHNTDNRNRPNARPVVIQHRGDLMVEALASSPLG